MEKNPGRRSKGPDFHRIAGVKVGFSSVLLLFHSADSLSHPVAECKKKMQAVANMCRGSAREERFLKPNTNGWFRGSVQVVSSVKSKRVASRPVREFREPVFH